MAPHDLFRLDPAAFVAARDELARELRAQGDRDEAAAVRKLRRPTVPAWALNVVSDAHADEIQALVDASEAARSAQQQVLEGADRELLREALDGRRSAMRAVVRRARAAIEESGRSADAQERELDAALLTIIDSPELTQALQRGELSDVRSAGDDGDDLSSLFAASIETTPKRSKQPQRKLTVVKDEPDRALLAKRKTAHDKLQARQDEVATAAEQLAAAEASFAQAEREVTRARKEHDKAQEAVERAERAVRELE